MIEFISGKLVKKYPNYVIINNNRNSAMYDAISSKSLHVFKLIDIFLSFISFSMDLKTA